MQDDIKRLYRTARWQAIRQQTLIANPLCTYCEQAGRTVPAHAVDHITPHRGNLELFWSGPFQGLCEPCHNGVKQREDNAGRTIGVGVDGWPIDKEHHWNT